MASLALKHIDKVYENTVQKKKKNEKAVAAKPANAVTDFNLEIEDKEFLVLVGPSGCGKSTTLRMIAGLEEITAGELFIDGEIMNHIPSKDRDIAMVFQSYALYPHMTVFDNMAFALKLRGVPKTEIQNRVEEAAEILELTDYLKRKPKALSGGQRQRVALGRAIVRKPKVFLMDEPLSNLDAKLRVAMRTEIEKLHKKLETTFIYVTHDQIEAMTMGDRIVVMKDGFVQQIGTPTQLYNHPQNKFVAEFIGSPQMNVFAATLKREGEEVFAVFGHSSIKVDVQMKEEQKDVFLGIRPEDIYAGEENLSKYPVHLEAEMDVWETLGSDIYLYVKIQGVDRTVTARVHPSFDNKGKSGMTLALDTNKMHIFDAQTEQVILQEGRA